MSSHDKAILPDDHALDTAYALRPSTSMLESGSNGEWAANVPMAEPASGPQFSTYLHALRRHWLLATALGMVLAATIGVSVYFSYGSRYTAEAFMQCHFKEQEILKNSYSPVPTEIEFDVFKNSQMSMLTNRLVLNSALNREEKVGDQRIVIANIPELARENEDDPVEWLTKRLAVSFPRKDEIMKVSIATKSPVHSAAIVQAVVNAYWTEVVDADRKKRDERISELGNIKVGKQEEVKSLRNELRNMAKNLGTSETDTINIQQQNLLGELASIRTESIRHKFELNRMLSDLASQKVLLKALEAHPITDIDVQLTCVNDPVLREYGLQLVMEKEYEDFARQALAKSGKAQGYVNKLARVQKKYAARTEELRGELMLKKSGEIEGEIAKIETQVAIAEKQDAIMDEELKRLRKEADLLGMSSVDMQMRRASITTAQKSLDDITVELEKLYVEKNRAPRVMKLQEVVEPPRNESSYMIRVALAGMASLVGFCVPFLGIVVWDLQSNRINSATDVVDHLGLPVIGSVPRIPARILHHQGAPKKSHQSWQLRLTESVDGISARLLRQAETEQRRVVMVTSAMNGEGKTTLTAQLAMSLARSGRRTLLVDFDLRQPTFDEVFGLPRTPGISEVLRGESDLSACIHATGTENLSVLTAGCWDRFALAALANHSVASMFKELREDYEFVIVDTSPILPIADTRFVSQYVDSVVLCVFRDISQAPRIRAACEILEAFGVRSVEAVVTGVNDNLGGNRIGYYQPAASAAS